MTAATKDTLHSQMEHLQSKYVGTGHADTSKLYVAFLLDTPRNSDAASNAMEHCTLHEWMSNIHRDSIASYLGHAPMITYFSVALNQSVGRTRYNLINKMVAPVGPPPPPEDLDGDEMKE